VDEYVPVNPLRVEFGDTLRLIDYQVTTDVHGELVVKFLWQALEPVGEDVRFYIAYVDADGQVLHDSPFYPPVASLWYSTSQWTPGETVLVQTLPWTLDDERFTLVLGLYTGEDGWHHGGRLPLTAVNPDLPVLEEGTLVRLGGYQRTDTGNWQPVVEPPPAEKQLDVRFGGQLALEGVSVPERGVSPGDSLEFTLHWRALTRPDADYSTFVHLLDSAGDRVAQLDWQPRDSAGLLPVTAWVVGQAVVDTEILPLPATLAPGDYRLIVGVYNWQDGRRLPATGPDAIPGDVATIAQIHVD
jgi:hypothetical protein